MRHGGDIYRNKVTIDYSVNINPLGIPESVRQALMEAVENCQCYPDIEYEALKRALSHLTGAKETTILCGNGASELFVAIVRGLMPEKIMIPVPSFFGYENAATACHGSIFYYNMKEDKGFCLDEGILDELTDDVNLLFLANPNNPVGNRIAPGLLEKVLIHCREKNIAVVLDECFIEFTEEWQHYTYLQRTEDFPNLIVVRAFTKIFAIPGVRLGYLVCGNPLWMAQIKKQLPEWNLSVFAQKAGVAAAGETNYCRETIDIVKAERTYLTDELQAAGIRVYPGTANYLLVYTKFPLKKALLLQGILIRDCSNFRGLSDGYYRIAVKLREENKVLLDIIHTLYQKAGDTDDTDEAGRN